MLREPLDPQEMHHPHAPRYHRWKARVFELLEPNDDDSLIDWCVNGVIIALIFLSVCAVIMSTVPGYAHRFSRIYATIEAVCVCVFSLEYVLRVWTCTALPEYAHPVWGRLRFVLVPLSLIDLLALLPFYLPFFFSANLLILRAFRLFRIFRLLKIIRYSESLKTLAHVFRQKRDDLSVTAIFAGILLVIASSLVYMVENPVQPDKFPSIPAAMWWGVVTLTTVGYGDVFPITSAGKCLGGLIAFLGIGLFALPAGILGSGFVEEMQQRRRQKEGCCPHCGHPYANADDHQEGC